ncbi:carbohydrate-binding protein [Echinimonas agarilytica]|uniref:Carbohydrate-binding protein n=1 Tax=Echinimonas agarilytica TaxID=1215918 RepID=A0AA42B5T7_9GAMM|nr:carbohydrate-binding protein [Echinimonas agarilytica]MCM2678100.1 carbohydrate-binding protein [Echinimonas agarilytica]
MTSKKISFNQVAAAVICSLALSACQNESAVKPKGTELTPNGITFESYQLNADDYSGERKQYSSGLEGGAVVSGLSEFANYSFTVTAEDVYLPDPTKCPSDNATVLTKVVGNSPVSANIAKLSVSGDTNATSVIDGDSLEFIFDVPDNSYGVTYEASLDLPDGPHVFSLSIPAATDLKPDNLEFKTDEFLVFTDIVAAFDDGAIRKDEDYEAVPLTETDEETGDIITNYPSPGSTAAFRLTDPVAGISASVKSEFVFSFPEGQTYLDEEGNEQPIAKLLVSEGTSNVAAYSSCAKAKDELWAYFDIPEQVYSQTYTSQLNWTYEEFDEASQSWVEKLETFNFSMTTEPFDDELEPLMFEPVTGVEAGGSADIPVDLTGVNTPFEVVVENALFSIDGGEFTDTPQWIWPGQSLVLRVLASDEYFTQTNSLLRLSVPANEEQGIPAEQDKYIHTIVVESSPAPEWPQYNTAIDFPAAASATAADTVILRGSADLLIPDSYSETPSGITADDLLINDVPVDSFDTATGVWTHTVTLVEGSNDFSLTTSTDIERELSADPQVKTIAITKLENKFNFYPNETALYTKFIDVTVDGREQNPTFYVADEGHQVVKLDVSDAQSVEQDYVAKDVFDPSQILAPVTGVQVNNGRKEKYFQERFLIHVAGGAADVQAANLVPYEDATVLLPKATEKAFLAGDKANFSGSHLAIDDAGEMLYLSGSDGVKAVRLDYELQDINPVTGYTHEIPFADESSSVTLVSSQFQTQSLDLYTAADGRQYLLVLSRADELNSGMNELYVVAVSDDGSYDAANSATPLSLDDNGSAMTLSGATAIAVDDQQMAAYITQPMQKEVDGDMVDSSDILVVQLANIDTSAILSASSLALISGENEFDSLSSVVFEGGLDYLVATDGHQNALYAIDHKTGERVYLLQASDPNSGRQEGPQFVTIEGEEFVSSTPSDSGTVVKGSADDKSGVESIKAGASASYFVRLEPTSQTMDVTFYASAGSGGEIRVFADGVDLGVAANVVNNGGWSSYNPYTATLDISDLDFIREITLVFESVTGSTGWLMNVDKFDVAFDGFAQEFEATDEDIMFELNASTFSSATASPHGPTPTAKPDNGTNGTVESNKDGATISYDVAFEPTSDTMDMTVWASAGGGGDVRVLADGVDIGVISGIANNGGWGTYNPYSGALDVSDINHIKQLTFVIESPSGSSGWLMNIDQVEISYVGYPLPLSLDSDD